MPLKLLNCTIVYYDLIAEVLRVDVEKMTDFENDAVEIRKGGHREEYEGIGSRNIVIYENNEYDIR